MWIESPTVRALRWLGAATALVIYAVVPADAPPAASPQPRAAETQPASTPVALAGAALDQTTLALPESR